jgi:hypothetical protein
MKVGAVKTECAEIVKPTLCLIVMGDTTNHQSSNQLRLEVVQEPLSLGRFDGSAFKKWDPAQLVVKESEIAFARIKIDFVVRNTRWGIASKYLHTNLSQFETQL